MKCELVQDGSTVLVICRTKGGKVSRRPAERCRECNTPASRRCDFPVRNKDGKLVPCDYPMCQKHANQQGPNVDYCRHHVGEKVQF